MARWIGCWLPSCRWSVHTLSGLALSVDVPVLTRPGLILVEAAQVLEASKSFPRAVLFSSFDPDICSALRQRQADYPVYFLSDGGSHPHADLRRTSFAAALDWAATSNLQVRGVPLAGDSMQGLYH